MPKIVGGQELTTAAAKLKFETKRESPLDLSVKTVCRSADSTDDRLYGPFAAGHDIPKVNFKPDFNACRPPQPPATSSLLPSLPGGGRPLSPHCSNVVVTYHSMQPAAQMQQLGLTVPSTQQTLPSVLVQPPTPVPAPPVVAAPPTAADESWRAAIDRQIEQKFNLHMSSKKQPHHHRHHHHRQQQSQPPLLLPQPPLLQPQGLSPQSSHPPLPQPPLLQPQVQQPAQADKRVLEILKQNIEARDHSGGGGRPQMAESPSTPAMAFSVPVRKEHTVAAAAAPLKKHDYYNMAASERIAAVTPFPKKIDYYMDRTPYCNAPRIRTKAERKQVKYPKFFIPYCHDYL